jgi:hypothetical protein
MSETVSLTVLEACGARLRLRVVVNQPDEQLLCISRAFFAAQLGESTGWGRGKDQSTASALGEALSGAGLTVWGDDLSDAQITRLDKVARKYIREVELKELRNGRVLAQGRNVWRITDEGKRKPSMEVTLELTDSKYAAHLKKGDGWGSSPPAFGDPPGAEPAPRERVRESCGACKCGGQRRELEIVASSKKILEVDKAGNRVRIDPATLGKRNGDQAAKIRAAGGTPVLCGSCGRVSQL